MKSGFVSTVTLTAPQRQVAVISGHLKKCSGFFHELSLQPHLTDAVYLAVNVVVAFDETDILYARAHFYDR
jgi:hypothetical protein